MGAVIRQFPVKQEADEGGNALDRMVSWLVPQVGLRRMQARLALRAYEAASPRDSWRPRRQGASANSDHLADATTLRNKARALVQNVPYCAAALNADVANVVGTGILPRFDGPQAEKLNGLLERWVPQCDADGRLDLHGIVASAYRAMRQDGEVLLRLRPRRPEDGLAVPLQLQLLEIDWLDSSRNSANGYGGGRAGVPTGNEVIEGVEYDFLGRVAAYWLYEQHPGDTTLKRGARTQSRRVPAENIIHLYTVDRPGQGRGITAFAPVITRARDTQLLEDAELARKNLESRLGVLVSGDASMMANPMQLGGSSESGSPSLAARTGDLGELSSGGITELPPGMNVTTLAPHPVPGHVENVKWHVHLVTAALNVTYEQATGDMREVNFSSARVRQLDVRRQAEQMQWLTLMPRLIRPICDAMVRAAELGGAVPVGAAKGYKLDASTPKWDYVNPAQEVTADLQEVAGGLCTFSEKLRRRGYKPDDVFAEYAADVGKLKSSGVLDVIYFLLKGKEPQAEAAATAAEGSARTLSTATDILSRMDARLSSLEQRSTSVTLNAGDTHVAVPERSVTVESPAVSVTNEVNPTPVHTDVRVEAAQVNVTNEVNPTPVHTDVRVEAAQVHVTNDVQPASVELRLPERVKETRIEKDAKGQLTARTIEKDA